MPRRIGILGGTFDPVHFGHLVLAVRACEQLTTDEFLLIPNARSPFKNAGPYAAFQARCDMLELAAGEFEGLRVSAIEGRRGGVSYTVDTLRELRAANPGCELIMVIGADALRDLPSWHEADTVCALATIAVVARDGDAVPDSPIPRTTLAMPRIDISATEIRDRVVRGRSIAYLTPASVVSYIRREGLYRSA